MSKKLSNLILSTQNNVIVNSELAVAIGLNEAIVLRQVYYWLEINEKIGRNFHDGKYWTYNTLENWQKENFPWWSTKTVERAFKGLINSGIIITGNYNRDSRDRTKWYSIDEDVLEKVLGKIIAPEFQTECSSAIRQNDEMHGDNMGGALPENNYREYQSDNSKDFNKSFIKDQNTLPEGKDYQTSANPEIPFISPRTEEQKITRYNATRKRKEDYSDAELPDIIKKKFETVGRATNSFQHEIELGTILTLRFFARYEEYRGEKHPMISDEQVSKILDALYNPDSQMAKDEIEDDEEIRYYLEMIEEHFKTNWGKNNNGEFDYRIMLFFGAKTQDMLYNRVKQKWNE